MTDFILEGEGISLGDVTVRIARDDWEIRQAQKLRYQIFYEEFNAKPTDKIKAEKRDFDQFDDYADHLVVIDKSIIDKERQIVGTYRLLRQDMAEKAGQFYTADEFDISKLLKTDKKLLEMGRSCVYEEYRTKAVLQLLWQGIAEYVAYYDIRYLFGCASFHGTNPDLYNDELSYLYYRHLAPEDFRPTALPDVYTKMDRISPEDIDGKKVLRNLPPLIKGYIRIGGFIGDGAFIDYNFDTIDVCVILKTSLITDSYMKHYERKTGADFSRE